MSAIGKGDWVECVNAAPNPYYPREMPLVVGAVYLIEAVHPKDDEHFLFGTSGGGVTLKNVWTSAPGGFAVKRFRPIYTPKQSLIEGPLKPVDEQVSA